MKRDRHSAECSSNGKQALHFPRNSIENIIAKALAIALEHEHANECEGSAVKSTSEPKFAHACAKSVLQFATNAGGGSTNETHMGTHVKGKLLHARRRTCCVLQCKRRSNQRCRFENIILLVYGDRELLHGGGRKSHVRNLKRAWDIFWTWLRIEETFGTP